MPGPSKDILFKYLFIHLKGGRAATTKWQEKPPPPVLVAHIGARSRHLTQLPANVPETAAEEGPNA